MHIAGSQLFSPFRALGYISNGVPFALQALGSEHFIATVVGRSFHLYNCKKLNLLFVGTPQSNAINCITTHSELVITAAGNQIKAWKRGKQVYEYIGHKSDVQLLLPFAHHLLSVDKNNCLRIWEIKSAELYLQLEFDASSFDITTIMHPSTYLNKILLGSKQGSMQLWNIKTSKMIYTFAGWSQPITVIEQAPVVDVVAVGLQNGKIILHNLKFDETVMSFMQDWGAVTAISFRTDSQAIMATGSALGHIALWNLEERCLSSTLRHAHDGSITAIRFLQSQPLLISTSPDNSLKMWIFDQPDGSGRVLKSRCGHSGPPSRIRFHGSRGHTILSAGQDRSLRITSTIRDSQNCELSQGSFLKKSKNLGVKMENLKLPIVTDFASEETRQGDWDGIVTCHYGTSQVRTWNFQNKCIGKHSLEPKHEVNDSVALCATISSCGNFTIIGHSSGHVDIYNIQSGLHRGSLGQGKAHEGIVRGVVIDGLNQQIITASSDKSVKFWHFKSKCLQATLRLDVGVSQIVLHRESALMAVALDDFTIKIVDTDIKRVVRQFSGHRNRITDVAFSPDARWLITCSLDSTIRTWDLPSGRILDCFLVESPATSLSISPVGDFLATAHVDDVGIYLWANKALYSNASIIPLPADFQPSFVDLPSAKTSFGEDDEDEDSKFIENSDEETVMEEEMITDEKYKSPDQISSELITLSLLPESRWRTLLNLDVIKQRNKPKEPPKAPKSAPFFLPTIPGVDLKFDVGKDDTETAAPSKMRHITNFTEYSEFQQLLVECRARQDYQQLSRKLKELGPSAIDAEFRCLAPGAGGDVVLMENMMEFLITQLELRNDFELIQGYMALFLKLHGDIISSESSLIERAKRLEEQHKKCWDNVQDLLNQNLCLVAYFKSATI
ncbi:WD repeat-containing protein 36-like [Dendronephthya gigantea]|uniref:WD repeat-containing protein 36-like n=1 Tax=Dendronephthya gigantea TaxID=151771 RepID=UPI00106C227D|nr:WD repeat-containing protein 36-like [Dendronephthya gigantea]